MSMPTAAQIEAAVALPTRRVRVYLTGAWVDITSDIVDVEGDYAITGGSDDGVGFGVARSPNVGVTYARERIGTAWKDTPIEISFGFNGTNPQFFIGRITEVEEDRRGGRWTAAGYQELIAATPDIRTKLLRRRPVFTATTASSNEDPDNAGSETGIGNIILWRSGGRPYEQSATYPAALFYYSCQTAILAPEWTWLNGGDALDALNEICKAAGGVVYQSEDGVIRYQEPMSYGVGATSVHYTDSAGAKDAATRVASGLAQFGDIKRAGKLRQRVVDQIRCAFVTRRLQGVQRIYQDTTPRVIEASSAITITLDLQRPQYTLQRVVATGYTMRSTAATTTSDVTVTIGATYAQQVTITLTNTLSEPVGISELSAYGQPLVAVEEGTATYGTPGSVPRSYAVPESVYIQSKGYADRLCRLHYDWYATPRPPTTLSGCGFDPRRTIGEIVLLTDSVLGISAERHRVMSKRVNQRGTEMELIVVSVVGLPVSTDFFVNGTTYADGDVRQLIY